MSLRPARRDPLTETKGTVLVIDDEDSVRQVAGEILKYLGYSVLAASSGQQAVELLERGARPDVALLDLIMPGMTGFQTLRALRMVDPDLPVLITTGYADRGASESLVSEGADGFVNKPYHMEVLAAQLEKTLQGSKRPK